MKKELKTERVAKEMQASKASMKTEEIREVRTSLDKSLRTVEEDANNLRSMLGKSLRKIDRYTDAIRRGDLQSATETDGSTNDEGSVPDGDYRKSNSAKYARLVKRHARSTSAHVNLKDRYSLGRTSPDKAVPSGVIANHSTVNGTDSGTDNVDLQVISPVRRYRKGRKSVS